MAKKYTGDPEHMLELMFDNERRNSEGHVITDGRELSVLIKDLIGMNKVLIAHLQAVTGQEFDSAEIETEIT